MKKRGHTNRIHTASRWPVDGALSLAYTDLAFLEALRRCGIKVDEEPGCTVVYNAAEKIIFKFAESK